MMRNFEERRFVSQFFLALAFGAAMFAGVGAFGVDIWLASTQWLLVAVFLGIFALYLRLDGGDDKKSKK